MHREAATSAMQTFFTRRRSEARSPDLRVSSALSQLRSHVDEMGFKGIVYIFRSGPMQSENRYGNLAEFGMQTWFDGAPIDRSLDYLDVWVEEGGRDPISKVCSTSVMPVWWGKVENDGFPGQDEVFTPQDFETFSINHEETGTRSGVAIP
ncbi:MAG: hypothetical protein AAGL49_12100, partial [Pseudomonadota bacterium]